MNSVISEMDQICLEPIRIVRLISGDLYKNEGKQRVMRDIETLLRLIENSCESLNATWNYLCGEVKSVNICFNLNVVFNEAIQIFKPILA